MKRHRFRCSQVVPLLVLFSCFADPSAAQPVTGPRLPDPAYYLRRATWHETLIASREALARTQPAQDASTPDPSFISPILRSGDPARSISLSIAGQKELHLRVIGAPSPVRGAATWADARLVDAAGRTTRLCEIKGLEFLDGQQSIDVNLHSGVSGPLKIASKVYRHGVHIHAPSWIRVPLDRPYEKFEADLGIDDWVGPGAAVRFIATGALGGLHHDLWERTARDFSDASSRREMAWEREDRILDAEWTPGDYAALAGRYAAAIKVIELADAAQSLARTARDAKSLEPVRGVYLRSRHLLDQADRFRTLDFAPLRLAMQDLAASFPERYARATDYRARLIDIESIRNRLLPRAGSLQLADLNEMATVVSRFDALQREALLANPLLDFDQLLLLRRTPKGDPRMPIGTGYGLGEYLGLPRQTSKHSPDIEQPLGWDNEIAVLSPVRPEGTLKPIYRPDRRQLINDIDLHWDADRLLFSMYGTQDKWQIFETTADGRQVRQVTPGDQPDVHNYDPCYLPSGKIAFLSTAPLQGVPCNAGVIVGMMYTMNPDGSSIRQICFEQDHDYCPTVLNDGRLLYMRWDYTDTPHVWNRMLFACNPDGTSQMEYYGANSYWPNAIFYTRPIPNHPTQVVGIVTGHHVGRVGELVLFDPAKGRFETDGVVQRIPGRGKKVEPLIQDKLTEHSWPKFLHPYPLSDKYFLVAAKPTPDSLWGIYLADVFDNLVLIKEIEGQALLEPIPLRKTPRPPVIPDRVRTDSKDAWVYLMDVYEGPGLKGIPRGTVKKLRLFSYHFGYQRLAGIDHRVGADGPWEVKQVLGTVDVEPDGSAYFRVPPKTPFTLQPLDAEGKAIALMRTWMTAQPGETVSCVGCHDNRGGSPPDKRTIAITHRPQEIAPWRGPVRGFSFKREVQPVLDKHCVGCHDGKPRPDGITLVDLRGEQNAFVCFKGGDPVGEIVRNTPREKLIGRYGGIFEPSYIALRKLVRVGGLESDLHLLPPMEFHADTSELFQMLRKGHHGVQLDGEAWDRLATWVDLNAPCHGTWNELAKITANQRERRQLLQALYGGVVADPEVIPEPPAAPVTPIIPPPAPPVAEKAIDCPGWPFDAAEAGQRQAAAGPVTRSVDLGRGVKLDLVRIPAGRFIIGDLHGYPDEQPRVAVAIDKPFWMARCEITNAAFAQFDPTHDSRFEDRTSWIFSDEYLGWRMNNPNQPAVRVSWQQAMAFCNWLSDRTGLRFSLPSEAQWEYACRAGADTPLSFGALDADFSRFANLADASIRDLAYEGWRPKSPDIAPREARFKDNHLVTADVGSFQPNAWGLHDMHGNAAEWTRSLFRPYPYHDEDGRNDVAAPGARVVRGGSWYDRPARARASMRLPFAPYQRIFNVGFRVVCEP